MQPLPAAERGAGETKPPNLSHLASPLRVLRHVVLRYQVNQVMIVGKLPQLMTLAVFRSFCASIAITIGSAARGLVLPRSVNMNTVVAIKMPVSTGSVPAVAPR